MSKQNLKTDNPYVVCFFNCQYVTAKKIQKLLKLIIYYKLKYLKCWRQHTLKTFIATLVWVLTMLIVYLSVDLEKIIEGDFDNFIGPKVFVYKSMALSDTVKYFFNFNKQTNIIVEYDTEEPLIVTPGKHKSNTAIKKVDLSLVPDYCNDFKKQDFNNNGYTAKYSQCLKPLVDDGTLIQYDSYIYSSYDYKDENDARQKGLNIPDNNGKIGTNNMAAVFTQRDYWLSYALKKYNLHDNALKSRNNIWMWFTALLHHESANGWAKAANGIPITEYGNYNRPLGIGLTQITDINVVNFCRKNFKSIKSREDIKNDLNNDLKCGALFWVSLIKDCRVALNQKSSNITTDVIRCANSAYNSNHICAKYTTDSTCKTRTLQTVMKWPKGKGVIIKAYPARNKITLDHYEKIKEHHNKFEKFLRNQTELMKKYF